MMKAEIGVMQLKAKEYHKDCWQIIRRQEKTEKVSPADSEGAWPY